MVYRGIRDILAHAVLYQFQLQLLCLHATAAQNLDSDSESDSSSDSGPPPSLLMQMQALSSALTAFQMLQRIQNTRYLQPRHEIIKLGQLELLTAFAQKDEDLRLFQGIVRVSPFIFSSIVAMIEDDPVFHNNSHCEQWPVDKQLAVTLYRMGRYGNGGSLEDVARFAGVAHGTVPLFTKRCFDAIERLHPLFVRPLTEDEKEVEKQWMEAHVGFAGLWREGYVMYDGTIVPLCDKPAQNGQAYYTRKCNYGLNAQVSHSFVVLNFIFKCLPDWKCALKSANH